MLALLLGRICVKKKLLPLCIALLVILILAGVFLFRSPLLIITDSSFYQIYGSQRQRLAVLRTSLELFRRVIMVTVSEQAGPDVIALVVESVSRAPRAVLFPQRYLAGALHFRENNPGIPVLVMWGRNPPPAGVTPDTGLVFVRTDTATDLYRAGLSAAALTRETLGVLFFTEGDLRERYRQAFQSGLSRQGFTYDPVYLEAFLDYTTYAEIGCVVVAGPALRFLERNLEIPVILFSWIDPSMSPRSVRIIFDDSPLAQAARAARFISPTAGEIFVPSRPALLFDRFEGGRAELRKLRGLLRENL